MMRKAPIAVLATALIFAGFATIANAAEVTPVSYEPSSVIFANPERGFYHQPGQCQKDAFTEDQLRQYQTQDNVSLAMCIFYLTDFRDKKLDDQTLDFLDQQLAVFRAAGSKAILRFAYAENDTNDATKARVVEHLEQLAPRIQKNADVIAVMQAGFVGAYGEWWHSANFGTADPLTEEGVRDRTAVVEKELEILPKSRFVQLRMPKYKKALFPSGNDRVGHHNDCFLSERNDTGTFVDPDKEIPAVAAETAKVPMGGETCTPSRATCAVADEEMSKFHYSFLNKDWNDTVIAQFKTDKCLDDIDRKLGYRFALTEGAFPAAAKLAGDLPVKFKVKNDGYAAPFNARNVNLVIGSVRIPLTTDPRTWAPGTTTTVEETVTVPSSVPAGTYKLALELADPLLADNPAFSIRTANDGLWDASTGLNDLKASVTIG